MDIDNNVVDVHYEDLEKDKYYTIEKVAELLEINQTRIIFYCRKLKNFLNITTIDMFHIFDDIDIENLKRIKHLDIDKNMDMESIEEYLLSHQQEIIIKKDENKAIDKSFLNVLGQVLASQNQKIDKVLKNNDKMINIIEKLYDNQEKINQTLNSISNEVAVTKETNEKIEELRLLMEHRREKAEKEQKKTWLDKLLNR